MSKVDYEVNEQIVGKAKAVKDQLGLSKNITGEGKKRKFEVLWADNRTRTMTVFGIRKSSALQVQPNHVEASDVSENSEDDQDEFQDAEEDSSTSSNEEIDELNQAFLL
jgi:hypothetical protein